MSKNKNPYENLFGPDKNQKKNDQSNNQQYGQQNYGPYGQYPNQQQQPYGQNPQNGQYPNQQQQPYGQNAQYGQYPNQQQQPYGQNPQYGQYPNQQQQPYGQNNNNQQYNQNQQQPYGQNNNNQQYNQNQQQPYGQNNNNQYQQPYGQYNQQPPQYGKYPNQQQNPYGQNPQQQYPNQQAPQYGQAFSQNPNNQQPYIQYPNQQPYNQNPNQPQNNQMPSNQDLNKQKSFDENINRQQTQQQQTQYQPSPTQNNINQNPPMNYQNYPQPQLPPIDQKKVDADAAALRKAMKGFGTDEKAIIQIIANRTNRERLAMIDSFKRQFNRDLIKDLKSELSGNFENATLALFQDPITYDCFSLKKAMKGLGTNEDTLIEILCTRPNYYINQIKQKYLQLYKKTLEQELASELSGDLKKVMLTLASAFRSENPNPDRGDCHDKAEQLYKAGEKRLGTNEKVFYDILTKASPQELVLIDKIYEQNHKHGLLTAIDKEFSGNMKKLLKTIVHCSINPSEYFATRVNYAIKGLGTKDTLLIRILVTRDEIDMPQIKEAYKRLYKKDMVKDVESDTSGDYKRLLVELCSH